MSQRIAPAAGSLRVAGDDHAVTVKEVATALIRYLFFGRSVLATVGARLVGRPGGLGTWTFLGFFASLLPCFPLLMVVAFWWFWVAAIRHGQGRRAWLMRCIANLRQSVDEPIERFRDNRDHGSEDGRPRHKQGRTPHPQAH
jgi:hypothetical protein